MDIQDLGIFWQLTIKTMDDLNIVSNENLTLEMYVMQLMHLKNIENEGETKIDKWPQIDTQIILDQKIKIAVQINGKTREIIEVIKNLDKDNLIKESKTHKKINDSLVNKKIIKTVFVKNRIINYLVK